MSDAKIGSLELLYASHPDDERILEYIAELDSTEKDRFAFPIGSSIWFDQEEVFPALGRTVFLVMRQERGSNIFAYWRDDFRFWSLIENFVIVLDFEHHPVKIHGDALEKVRKDSRDLTLYLTEICLENDWCGKDTLFECFTQLSWLLVKQRKEWGW
jgi:hypothetical protein